MDNRCPHMGFPLHRGTVCDGILTCHWHHARFDLATGGTFDQWADELRRFPVGISGDDVLVDLRPLDDPASHHRERLRDGLERDIPLVLAKAAIASLEADPSGVESICAGHRFRRANAGEAGWFRGLTTLTCFVNLLPRLERAGPSRRALSRAGGRGRATRRWGRRTSASIRCLERDRRERLGAGSAASSRCGTPKARSGRSSRPFEPARRLVPVADMLFAAATDHRYLDGGHTLDFVNKALEALDLAGWERAEAVLARCRRSSPVAERMEEANAWRNPVDVVAILEQRLRRAACGLGRRAQQAAADGRSKRPPRGSARRGARGAVEALLGALRDGASEVELASAVSFAAVIRIARFPTSNEFGDWDTALHTFTFANAVEQGLRRSPSIELLRGVLDAAMSVHLDRFLNVPAARVPAPDPAADRAVLLAGAPAVARPPAAGRRGGAARRLATSRPAVSPPGWWPRSAPRSCVRTATSTRSSASRPRCASTSSWRDPETTRLPLIAAARYLAAHAATTRSQHQTFDIARRLHRGERLYEDVEVSEA